MNTPATQATAGNEASPAPRRGPGGRVLIVEDHDDTRDVLSRFLFHLGFDVTGAGTVAEAKLKLREPWEIVLSDIGLPDGSGLTIAQAIRAGLHRPRLVVALSGYGTDSDIAASYEAGFDAHLVKPITLEQLAAIVDPTAQA